MILYNKFMNGKAYYSHLHSAVYFNVIEAISRSVAAQSYLELGLWDANNYRSMNTIVPHCVGVDMNVHFEGEIPNFYQMTTDEFFAQNKEKFDLIFIDASHKFEQVKIDFENSINALEEMGIIILHDTDPAEEYMTIDNLCSNSYLMNEYIRKNHPEFSFVTLPVSKMGLTICNKFKELRHLKFSKLKSNFSSRCFENRTNAE